MSKKTLAVRGAVTLEAYIPGSCAVAKEESLIMVEALGRLMDDVCEENHISPEDIISIQFTQTVDLRWKNAAAALREARPVYSNLPLFCAVEPEVEGSLARTVRILVTWNGEGPVNPVYLGKAAGLRPDLTE